MARLVGLGEPFDQVAVLQVPVFSAVQGKKLDQLCLDSMKNFMQFTHRLDPRCKDGQSTIFSEVEEWLDSVSRAKGSGAPAATQIDPPSTATSSNQEPTEQKEEVAA